MLRSGEFPPVSSGRSKGSSLDQARIGEANGPGVVETVLRRVNPPFLQPPEARLTARLLIKRLRVRARNLRWRGQQVP